MAESITIDDAIMPIDSLIYTLHDLYGSTGIAISDASKYKNMQVFFDLLSIGETQRRSLARRYAESVKASSWQNKRTNTSKEELINLADTFKRAQKLLKAESIKLQRRVYTTVAKKNKETTSCFDMLNRQFNADRHFSERTSIHELAGKASQTNLRELIDVQVNAPCLNLPMTIALSANVKLDDADIPIDSFIYAYYEQKDCELWIRPNKQESCALGEAYRKNTDLMKNEMLLNGVSMRSQTFFDRFITENIETLETQNKAAHEHFIERLLSWDDKSKQISKSVYYKVAYRAGFDRKWSVRKTISEDVATNSMNINYVTISKSENPISIDAVRIATNPGGVLSDVFIRANEMSEGDFEKLSDHASGYNYFSPFRVGEYEYKDALYRIKIRKDNGIGNPLIYDYRVNVDIDDVKDRGTIAIPARETNVYFNRSYYTEPDVVVNVVSGEEGKVIIPFIITTDGEDDKGRYFTVILKDTSGNPVEGTISWNSNGY